MTMNFVVVRKETIDSVQEIDLRAMSKADDKNDTTNQSILPTDGAAIRNQCNLVTLKSASDSVFTVGSKVQAVFSAVS